jgi:tetratricopeptide (TPR) repeat protein/2-polyprenyl-3-methyl-5-hydroxy-6-metoxy-1,4-benzoquinol methylase
MGVFLEPSINAMDREQRQAIGLPNAPSGRETAPPAATADALFATAVARHQAGDLAEAERQYRQILARAPNHADSLHNLGLIALHSGNAAAAVELIEQAIARKGAIPDYHYNLALALRALNRADDAAAHLERAIALRGNYALAYINLGNIRREQGRLDEALVCYERVIALHPTAAAPHFNVANIAAAQGRFDEAAAGYREALRFEPNFAEAHAGLASALLARRNTAEAISHLQRAVAINPTLMGAYQDLAKTFLAAGDLESAIDTSTKALAAAETEQTKALFAQCIKYAQFAADNEQFRNLLLRAITEGWARPRELASVITSLVKLNNAVKDSIARVNAAWPARLAGAELFGPAGPAALARDRLFCALLECDPPTDIELERLLTSARYAMLTKAATATAPEAVELPFYCAIARQCFVNEYVFARTPAEADAVRQLRTTLEQALHSGASVPVLWPVAVAAYDALHEVTGADNLLSRSWPPAVEALLAQQIREPAEERRIAATMPVLTTVDDETSRLVRQQYEENPYPRWVRAGPPGQPAILFDYQPVPLVEVLIAGCGTGLSTIELAREARTARILAIDLSLASLSYAKRMAQGLNVANVEFAQADILRLGSIGRTFDFIDASGVLHHLADPWQGWQVLLSLLRPGGAMQIGLYSEAARRHVVAARALIASRGYQSTASDIRRCREDILESDDPLLRSIARSTDFFTTSECRDLLFHVQEHRTTLPQVKAFLAASNLSFAGFVANPTALRAFTARFPAPEALTDLDSWHAFETEFPETFAAMYLFSVRKGAPR